MSTLDPLPYIGYADVDWNGHTPEPGPLACISPRYGGSARSVRETRIVVPDSVHEVLQDSAAFADRHGGRISFDAALARQLDHARRWKYAERISLLASYDSLYRVKSLAPTPAQREIGAYHAAETIEASRYLAARRCSIREDLGHQPGLVLTAQGVDPAQYFDCAAQVISCMEEGDVFGFGGFVKVGAFPDAMMPVFIAVTAAVVPLLAAAGVRRVHSWGLFGYSPAIGHLLALCDAHGIQLSADSSGPALKPAMGDWGYGSWRNGRYSTAPILDSCRQVDAQGDPAPSCPSQAQCRGLERIRHVRAARAWFADFRRRESRHYRVLSVPDGAYYTQVSWLDVG